MKIIIKDLNFNGLSCSLKLFTRWRRAGWRFLVWKVAEDHWMLVSSNWRFVLIVRWRWMQVLGLELHTNFNYVKTELDRKAAHLPCSLLLLKEWHQLIKWVKQKIIPWDPLQSFCPFFILATHHSGQFRNCMNKGVQSFCTVTIYTIAKKNIPCKSGTIKGYKK